MDCNRRRDGCSGRLDFRCCHRLLELMEPPVVSVFTPFLRRFTDERTRDLSDTKSLYASVRSAASASEFAQPDAREKVGGVLWHAVGKNVPESLVTPFCITIDAILQLEHVMFDMPAINP